MSQFVIPAGALGHLCDELGLYETHHWEAAIAETANFIRSVLPERVISHDAEWSAGGEHDFFCEPPLSIAEAERFMTQMDAWADAKGYDFCSCYLRTRIEKLRGESL